MFCAQVLRILLTAEASQAEWWIPMVRSSPPSMKFACAAIIGCGGPAMIPRGDTSAVESLDRGK